MANMKAMVLLIIPILILIGVGSIYNNLNSNGFATTADSSTCTSLNCPAYTGTGCTANITNCQLTTGTSFSFLNPNSPFTQLFSLNLVGFVNTMFESGTQFGPTLSQNVTFAGNGSSALAGTWLVCPAPQYGTSGASATFNRVHYASNYQTNSVLQFQCSNPTYGFSTTGDPFLAPIYFTCLYWNGTITNSVNNPKNFFTYCNIVGSNSSTVSAVGYAANCWIFGNATDITNTICGAWSAAQSTTTALSISNIFNFFAFVGGIILLYLALGVSGTFEILGTGVSFGDNSQGSKLAGSIGFGLILWSPIYSEFGSWLTSTTLGFGVAAIVTILLEFIFFAGIYWQTQSYF